MSKKKNKKSLRMGMEILHIILGFLWCCGSVYIGAFYEFSIIVVINFFLGLLTMFIGKIIKLFE